RRTCCRPRTPFALRRSPRTVDLRAARGPRPPAAGVDLRLRLADLESDVPLHSTHRRTAVRLSPRLLSVVAREPRNTGGARASARLGSGWILHRIRISPGGVDSRGRDESDLASRDDRRHVLPALDETADSARRAACDRVYRRSKQARLRGADERRAHSRSHRARARALRLLP